MAKLFRVIFPVGDIKGAERFYETVFAQKGQRVSPGRHCIDCEGTILALYDPQADGDGHDAQPVQEPVYIAVDDLDATFRRAKDAGGTFSTDVVPNVGPLGQIAQRPWGERSFYARHPFGNPLCFVSRDSVFIG